MRHLILSLSLLAACSKADSSPLPEAEAKPAPPKAAQAETPPPPKEEPEKPLVDPSVQTWTFDDEPGELPAGFRIAETGGQGTPATWKLVEHPRAPSPPKAFGVVESKNDKRTYNLALAEGTEYTDVDLSVMVRAVSGNLNQGGGPIWRAKDADNYYIARWDPSERNVYFYVVVDGVRTTLAKTDLDLDATQWHELRVVHEGTQLSCYVDDEPTLQVEDAALPDGGMIGLWTKSDAVTLFDDLSVGAP